MLRAREGKKNKEIEEKGKDGSICVKI